MAEARHGGLGMLYLTPHSVIHHTMMIILDHAFAGHDDSHQHYHIQWYFLLSGLLFQSFLPFCATMGSCLSLGPTPSKLATGSLFLSSFFLGPC